MALGNHLIPYISTADGRMEGNFTPLRIPPKYCNSWWLYGILCGGARVPGFTRFRVCLSFRKLSGGRFISKSPCAPLSPNPKICS